MSAARCWITLDDVLAAHLERAGYDPSEYDVSAVQSIQLLGFRVMSRQSGARQLEGLLDLLGVVYAPWDGKMVFRPLQDIPTTVIPSTDIGWRILPEGNYPQWGDGEAPGELAITLQPERELPFQVEVSYQDVVADYETGIQRAQRYTRRHLMESVTVGVEITMLPDDAAQAAERLLWLQWVGATSATLTLAPRWLSLAPTDVIEVPSPMGPLTLRIVQVRLNPFGPLEISAVQHDVHVMTQVKPGQPYILMPPRHQVRDSVFFAWNGNALQDEDAEGEIGFYMAASGVEPGDWLGITVWWSRNNGVDWETLQTMNDGAPHGLTVDALPPGRWTAVWDDQYTLDVELKNGILSSTSEGAASQGANVALVGDEVIRFTTVTPLGGDIYRLSHLARGQRGTDAFWNEHAAAERFVILDPAWVVRVKLDNSFLNQIVLLKPVPSEVQVQNVAAVPITIWGRERKPYAPAHLSASRSGADWVLGWIRRTRIGSAGWISGLVPLGEAVELYDVEILDGTGAVIRTKRVTSMTATYTLAEQQADFGVLQNTLHWRVYQIGQHGRGYPSESTDTVVAVVALSIYASALSGLGGLRSATILSTSSGQMVANAQVALGTLRSATLFSTGNGTITASAQTKLGTLGAVTLASGGLSLTATALAKTGTLVAATIIGGAAPLTATPLIASRGMGAATLVSSGGPSKHTGLLLALRKKGGS